MDIEIFLDGQFISKGPILEPCQAIWNCNCRRSSLDK